MDPYAAVGGVAGEEIYTYIYIYIFMSTGREDSGRYVREGGAYIYL
jgi:hypothetical protein